MATPTADSAAVDAMRRQATQLMQRNDRLQALAVVEKGLRASPGDAQLQQMVTTLLRDAQQSTASAKDDAVKAEAPKFAESMFGEGTRLEADAAAKARAADRPGSIRSLLAATDAFGKSTAAARDASAKASAAEVTAPARSRREAAARRSGARETARRRKARSRSKAEGAAAARGPAAAASRRSAKGQRTCAAIAGRGRGSRARDAEAVRSRVQSLDVAAVTRVFSGARANQLAAAFKQSRSYSSISSWRASSSGRSACGPWSRRASRTSFSRSQAGASTARRHSSSCWRGNRAAGASKRLSVRDELFSDRQITRLIRPARLPADQPRAES